MTVEEKLDKLRRSQRAIIRGFCALLRDPHATQGILSAQLARELDKLHDDLNEENFQ